MEEESIVSLFFEVVLLMGMRGYNTMPFEWLIERKMINEAYINTNQKEKIIPITKEELSTFIYFYRTYNFKLNPNDYTGERKKFSVCFDRPSDGMRTLVIFGEESDKDESMSHITLLIENMNTMVQIKTEGRSQNCFDTNNKCSAIYVVSKGISSYTSPLLEKYKPTIQYFTDVQLLTRSYDNCLQSYFTNINERERNILLSEVHLVPSKIPSTPSNDIITKLMGYEKKSLNLITREAISPEETEQIQTFIRLVK